MQSLKTFFAVFASIAGFAAGADAQTLLETELEYGEPARFDSLGIDEQGAVVIAGDGPDGPLLFRVSGSNIVSISIPVPQFSGVEGLRISRDAKFLVAQVYDPESDDGQLALWSVATLTQPLYLQDTNQEPRRLRPRDITSIDGRPVILGYDRRRSFLWSEVDGFRYWGTREDPTTVYRLDSMSSDASRVVGTEYKLAGTNLNFVPIVTRGESVSYLDSRGSLRGEGYAISPNGQLIVGRIEFEAVVWEKGNAHRISRRPGYFPAITDSGWTAGVTLDGVVLYDGKGGKVQMFDTWWADAFPDTALPIHITRVNDIYEHAATLYFVLEYYDEPSNEHRGLVAIVPLSALKRGKQR